MRLPTLTGTRWPARCADGCEVVIEPSTTAKVVVDFDTRPRKTWIPAHSPDSSTWPSTGPRPESSPREPFPSGGDGGSGSLGPDAGTWKGDGSTVQPAPANGGSGHAAGLTPASAPRLAAAWDERWARSRRNGPATPAGPRPQSPGLTPDLAGDAEAPTDPGEVERALAAVRADVTLSSLFTDGARHPNGHVDRSQTEFHMAAFLKGRGFSEGATWEVVRACPHTKSPRDARGFGRFERQVWGRLADAP